MKKCSTCHDCKETYLFPKDKRSKDGYLYKCKDCYNKQRRDYLDKHRERARESSARWYYKYHEKINSERRIKAKSFTEKQKIAIRESQKRHVERNRELIRKRALEASKTPESKASRNARRQHLKTEFLFKVRARKILQTAVRVGHIRRPSRCDRCLKECKPHGHHEDYSKPLEVKWLCKVCHNHEHNKLLDVTP